RNRSASEPALVRFPAPQPNSSRPELGMHSPIPVKKEIRRCLAVADLREVVERLIVFLPIKFRITGGGHGDRPRLNGVLFRIETHDDLAQVADSFEIKAERAQPCFAENEHPRVVPVLFGNFPSVPNNFEYLAETAQLNKGQCLCAHRKNVSCRTAS